MTAFCDEDGYDSPHKDFFKFNYHDKNQEVWLTLSKICKMAHKIFQSRFSLCLATSNDHNFNTFWMTDFI